MEKLYWLLFVFVMGAFCFGFGYDYASKKYELEIAEMQRQLDSQSIEILSHTRDKETKAQSEVTNAISDLQATTEKLDTDYRLARTLLSDNVSDGLHHSESSQNSKSVSDAPRASCDISKARLKRYEQDNRKLQRLYERQLELAHACDLKVAKLNSLIDFYNNLVKEYNNAE